MEEIVKDIDIKAGTGSIDCLIIGGGASGITASITVKRDMPDATVCVIEKNEKPLKKVLATGNGRCNLSNARCRGKEAVLSFFDSVGIMTRSDSEGRIYPYTEDAKDVVNALTEEAERLGVTLMTGAEARACSFDDKAGEYAVTVDQNGETKTLRSADLLISCGGKAAPEFGTTGDGYRFAKSLYHSVTKLAPALTAVETHEDLSSFKGIRAKARVSLMIGGGAVFSEEGEVQFTDYGISGIVVFDMTRFMEIPEGRTLINGFDDYAVEIDFLPGIKDAAYLIKDRFERFGEGPGALRSIVKEKIAEYVIDKTKGDPEMTAWLLKHFMLRPKKLKGWDKAEITKGGIPLNEIRMERMASKFMPGLFFAGEIIDIDGPTGGFNLENAWETGMTAGHSMAQEIAERK